jgi:2-haloacid dehalogenase
MELTPATRQQLMAAYLRLQAWFEVPQALQALKQAGLRLAFLSNATPQILHAGIKNAQLEGVFDQVLSTDQVRTYQPDPRAYQMALEALGLQREAILFVACAGWDVAGATWFGSPTFWVNRLQLPAEGLGVVPDAIGRDLTEVVRFVQALP